MINIESVRRLLAVADAAKDPYAVVDVANSLLMANPGDQMALAHYARALVALKMFGAARRVLPEMDLGGASGVIGWASRARRFAANLTALEARDVIGATLVREAAAGAELSRYELHLGADGNYQLLDTMQTAHAGWIGGFRDHKATESLFQFDAARGGMPNPIGFDGVGFGWLFLHALKVTERSFLDYSCAFYVLESDPTALAVLFHIHDLRNVILQSRVRWFVRGSRQEVVEAFREAMKSNPGWTLPGQFVRCALQERPAIGGEVAVKELRAEREVRAQGWIDEAKDYYAGKDAAYWAVRYEDPAMGRGPPLRVLGITSRYTTVLQHSMAEMEAAVTASGAEMRVAIEGDDQSLENPCLEMIASFKPDLIFQISRMRYEHPSLPSEIPFLCWDQDNLPCMRTAGATESLDALTYVAGHGAVFGYTTLGWPRENCLFCHPAGATHRYQAEPLSERRGDFLCDVSYVSNASGMPSVLAEQLRRRWEKDLRLAAIFDEAMKNVLAKTEAGTCWDYVSLLNYVKELPLMRGVVGDAGWLKEMVLDLNTFADRCFRHTTLGWVSRWCAGNGKVFRLYGRGWEGHAEFGRWAAGVAEPGEMARAIFQGSRINLQIIESGFIHSRSLDGLTAGGFFLTRATPADGLGVPGVTELHALARWVVEHDVRTDEELDQVLDVGVREKVAAARAYYLRHGVTEPMCRSLHVWAEVPPAGLVMPQLDAITFRDEAEFGALAGQYLEDEAGRLAMAREMREVVLQKFSYGARWENFLKGMRRGFGGAGNGGGGKWSDGLMALSVEQSERLMGRFPGLKVGNGCTVVDSWFGEGVVLEDGAVVEMSAVGSGTVVGARAILKGVRVGRDCRIGTECRVGEAGDIFEETVIGDGMVVEAGQQVRGGVAGLGDPEEGLPLREFLLEKLPLVHVWKKWAAVRGDETLRVEYPLDAGSLVIDVGGYLGDFAAEMVERYGCKVQVFEPVRGFAEGIRQRFTGEGRVVVHDVGMAGRTREEEISVASEGSSVMKKGAVAEMERIRLVAGKEIFTGISGEIDLMKINVEGCEYELLEHLMVEGLMGRVRRLQVQFHDFVPDARGRRRAIREGLRKTHVEQWNYPFIWEGWERIGGK